MADNGEITEGMSNRRAMQEVAAATLRVDAIKLLAQGESFRQTSRVVASGDDRLQIETTDNKAAGSGQPQQKSMMTVAGNSSFSGTWTTSMNSDFTITTVQGGCPQVMKGQFSLSGSNFDALFGDYHRSERSVTLTDAAGEILHSYEPGKYTIPADRLDANGQPVRLIEPADGESNCGWEDDRNSKKGVQCVFLLRDSKRGDFGYFQTATRNGDGSLQYRAVLRGKQGGVFGIVEQDFSPDGSIVTTARRPSHLK